MAKDKCLVNASGLTYNSNSGEGDFVLPFQLKKESSLFRVDVLNDWITDMQTEKAKAVSEFFTEQFLQIKPSNPKEHYIELLKKAFDRAGINLSDYDIKACEQAYINFNKKNNVHRY